MQPWRGATAPGCLGPGAPKAISPEKRALAKTEVTIPRRPVGIVDVGKLALAPANLSVSGIVVDSTGWPVKGATMRRL